MALQRITVKLKEGFEPDGNRVITADVFDLPEGMTVREMQKVVLARAHDMVRACVEVEFGDIDFGVLKGGKKSG